jgi:large conductance mechanosensitive channel
LGFSVFLIVKAVKNLQEKTKKEESAAPVEPTEKTCPFCQQSISIKATRCPFCTSQLETD